MFAKKLVKKLKYNKAYIKFLLWSCYGVKGISIALGVKGEIYSMKEGILNFSGNFYLIDPAFAGKAGHGMTFGSGVVETSNEHNISMNMVVNKAMPHDAIAQYQAIPAFTSFDELQKIRYKKSDNLSDKFVSHYCTDLNSGLAKATQNDVLWDYYTFGPIQVVSYIVWLLGINPIDRPKLMVAMDLYTDFWREWLEPYSPHIRSLENCFRITSASASNAEKIGEQLDIKVQWMPRPMLAFHGGDGTMVDNLKKNTYPASGLVGFFADPTTMKSFDILPSLLEELMVETGLRFVIQIRYEPPEDICRESEKKIRALANMWPERIIIIDGMMTYEGYKTAVKECDGLLVIYDPKSHFSDTPAGTMCEALAVDTIPLVIKGTSMKKEFDQFGIDIPVIEDQIKESFKKILVQFDTKYPEWLRRNKSTIDDWNAFQCHETLYKTLFEDAWG